MAVCAVSDGCVCSCMSSDDAVKEKTLEYLKKKERKALKAKKKRVSAESFPSTGSEHSLETVSRAGFERGTYVRTCGDIVIAVCVSTGVNHDPVEH